MKKKTILMIALSRHPWIGGIYYKKNIIFSLLQNERIRKDFQIVVLVNQKYSEIFSEFSEITMITCKDDIPLLQAAWTGFCCFLKYRIKFIFPLKNLPGVKLLGIMPISWIADFQHNYFPEFFSRQETAQRNSNFKQMAEASNPLVVSSEAAREDLLRFYRAGRKNVHVVHFVSDIGEEIKELTPEAERKILEQFSLQAGTYICISNQFWQHKNHKIVFQAIQKLDQEGLQDVMFVFTGELKDRRNPAYYDEIQGLMKQESIKKHIKVLGFISRTEQIAVMKNAKFLIQPSLFEGWGTVLEDAKVLNQQVLLSDIPVHREQMEENCILFDPFQVKDLTEKIKQLLVTEYRADTEKGLADLYRRALEYSREFEKILYDEA